MDTTITKDKMDMTTKRDSIKGPAGLLYIDDGGTGGIPVVFVHSFAGSVEDWDAQLEHLRRTRRAIAFDMRGHGRSGFPDDNNYEVSAMASDIAAVVDSLELDSFILVGHSQGGSAAIAYAAYHPERVKGLVVSGTPGKSPTTLANQVIASLESDAYDKVMADYMNKLLTNAKPSTDKKERQGLSKIPKDASLRLIKALFQYDPLPDFTNYKGPKLIISAAAENQAHSLANSFPNVQHVVIEGTSHWTQMDKPGEFNKILDDFLKDIYP